VHERYGAVGTSSKVVRNSLASFDENTSGGLILRPNPQMKEVAVLDNIGCLCSSSRACMLDMCGSIMGFSKIFTVSMIAIDVKEHPAGLLCSTATRS